MKFRFVLWILTAIFFLLIIVPIISWYISDPLKINIAVIDKTVPNDNYNEHLGLFWLLNYNKVVNEAGDLYKYYKDYYGFHPYDHTGDKVLELPENLDLIYVADTYGVYSKENNTNTSSLTYGGLSIFDWNRIMAAKKQNTTLITEFSTLQDPTDPIVRGIMEKNLSIKWTGWQGKYFPDLGGKDIPEWVKARYKEINNYDWDLAGKGIIFADHSDKLVILTSLDFDGRVLFQMTEAGNIHYPKAKNSTYNNWFEVNVPTEATEGTEVEAVFSIDLTKSGKEKLQQNEIPLFMPAIIRNSINFTYYFSGDFAEEKNYYWTKWRLPEQIQNIIAFFYQRQQFFWRSYNPIMTKILNESAKHTER